MIDISSIFLLYEYIKKALGPDYVFTFGPGELAVFGIVLAALWVLSLAIPRPKDKTNLSIRNLFRILAVAASIVFAIAALAVYSGPIADWAYAVFGVEASAFWVWFVSIILLLVGLVAFIAHFFQSKEPNNESGLNKRQTCGVVCFLCWLALVLFLSWNFAHSALSTVGTVVIVITEVISILFWFYDPIIFVISRFVHIKEKPACPPTPDRLNRFAILGCAHNEEQVIGKLVESLYATTYPRDKYDVFVICDNCTDNTAQVVREAGAIAMERTDKEKRGKGFALEWMFDNLKKKHDAGDVYDAYIVLDADNLVNEQFLDEINAHLNEGYEIMQAYLGCKNPGDTWVSKCYSLAYWLSNADYQNAHSRLGLSAQMGGTGMVLRPSVLEEIGWKTDSLTEDLVLTTHYVSTKNKACHWVNEARLYDEKPLKIKPSIKQRTRWMQGHMAACFKYALPLLRKGILNLSFKQIDVALYLLRPLLNLFMFAVYVIRIFAVFFFPGSFMASTFLMDFNSATILLLAYILIQVYLLYDEHYLRYAIWIPLQWIYTYTWYGPIFRGVVKHKELYWVSTVHERDLSIGEVRDDVLLSEAQKRLEGLDNLHKLPLGQILMKAGVVTRGQLTDALAVQQKEGGFLGDILVAQGVVEQDAMNAYLSLQQSVKALKSEAGESRERMWLGEVLKYAGLVNQPQLDAAIAYQKENKTLLGEALVRTGALTQEVLDIFLSVQRVLDSNYVSIEMAHHLLDGMLNETDIGEVFYGSGMVSKTQLAIARQYQSEHGGDLADVFVKLGYVTEDDVNVIQRARRQRRGTHGE